MRDRALQSQLSLLLGHSILNTEVKAVLLNDLVSFFYSPPSDDSLLSQSEARVLTITVMC